jgi:hypothetical protein
MATTPLSQAVLQGMDPNVYRPLADIQQGQAMQELGMDSSPTTKWGAVGRLANALAGSYISNSSASDLAKTIASGKKSAADQLLAALEVQKPASVPSAAPAMRSYIPPSPAQPAVQPSVPQAVAPEPGSPNAQVADRFPAEWSPGTAASPLPNDAPSPLDTAQFPAGPEGTPSQVAATNPVAAINAATQPRGIRNNNPLNIEDGPFARSQPGYAGSDGRFAKFAAPEHGVAAASALLDSYDSKHGLNTVAGIVNRWAPPSDGNNTMAYAQDVAGKLGIDPNAPVPPALRPQLIAAMAQHENGVAAPGTVGAPVQLASAASRVASDADPEVPAPKGQQVAQAGQLDVHRLMAVMQNPYADDTTKALASKLILQQLEPKEDEFSSAANGVIYNKRTGEIKSGGAASDPFGGLQGPARLDAIKSADPARASQAQAVLEGRVPYPTGSRLNPQQQQLKEDVTQIDPNFSAAKWQERSNFQKSMGGTAPATFGGQVRSAGTVAKHLGDALEALPVLEKGALGASDTLPSLNGVKSFVRNQSGDKEYQDAVGHYETARKGLSDEVETLLAGGHGAEGSKLYWLDRLDISKHSPTEVRGALDEFRSLMNGRLSNVAQEKDRVFGNEPGHTDPLTLFGPHERDIMEKVQKGTYSGKQKAEAGNAPATSAAASDAPKAVSSKQEYDALPSGSSYVAPDGSVRTKK